MVTENLQENMQTQAPRSKSNVGNGCTGNGNPEGMPRSVTPIKDLTMRPETLKLLEEDVGRGLNVTGRVTDLLHGTLVAQKIMLTINKRDFMTLKRFCTANN